MDGNWHRPENLPNDGHVGAGGLNFADVMQNVSANLRESGGNLNDMRVQLMGTKVGKEIEMHADLSSADHCLKNLGLEDAQKAVDIANKTLQQDGSTEQLRLTPASDGSQNCALTLMDGDKLIASDSWQAKS